MRVELTCRPTGQTKEYHWYIKRAITSNNAFYRTVTYFNVFHNAHVRTEQLHPKQNFFGIIGELLETVYTHDLVAVKGQRSNYVAKPTY